MLLHCVVRVNI